MRLVYLILTLALIAAVAGPFFMKGPDGAPLMTVDKVVEDNVPDTLRSTEAYRWQDASGKWHFSDEPPQQSGAEQFTITPNHTTLERGWAPAEKDTGSSNRPSGIPILDTAQSFNPYDGTAIERAKAAAQVMQDRNDALDALVDHSK